MSKVEILNPKDHGHLKLDIGFSEGFDDVGPAAPVVADELPQVALDIPVFITKSPSTGEFELRALFGLSQNENLFIHEGRWRGSYIPLDVRRQPFQACFVGQAGTVSLGDLGPDDTLKIGLDVESARLVGDSGQALFKEDGTLDEYVESVSQILGALIKGAKSTSVFLKRLSELGLIAPANLEIAMPGQEKFSMSGLYGAPLERLANLDDDVVLEFHKNGYLQAIYSIAQSQGHLNKLLQWKSERA